MGKVITGSFSYHDAHLEAHVRVTLRTNARRIICRWKEGIVAVTVPPFTTEVAFMRAMDKFRPWLSGHRGQQVDLKLPETVRTDFFDLRFVVDERCGDNGICCLNMTPDEVVIGAGTNFATPDRPHAEFLAKSVVRLLSRLVPVCLKAEVEETFRRLGVRPVPWTGGRGMRALGVCKARGTLTFSGQLLLMERESRQYVICHEIAHLTHFDHSAAFHALLNSYLGGHEREYAARARRFNLSERLFSSR